ncbi:hypothetical protein LPU83_pLPU83d_1132 (plasmid) [Rhizobium favelukesii]|uniref:Uncharacterized protein n=1 Tax=Rhizobium favelukesii TaxID=348824 RepID=W6RN47_9HYPH|nr:hypothetical protein LPU83_pLPU83d_1132 [Rhizobium favelukesii]
MHGTQLPNVDGTVEFREFAPVAVHWVVTLTCTVMPSKSETLPS